MRVKVTITCIFIFFTTIASSQDTIFSKQLRNYSAYAIKSGYDIHFKILHKQYPDSVSTYQYGAYMHTKILDIVLCDTYFIILYEQADCIAYTIFEYTERSWRPLMGNALVFFNRTRIKVDASIVKGNRFRLVEEDGRETILKINFANKTLEPYDK